MRGARNQVRGDRFERLLDAAPDGIVGVDSGGRIILVNTQLEALFGYARQELLGEPVELLVPKRLRRTHALNRQDYFSNPGPLRVGTGGDLYVRRRDGSEFPAEIGLSAITLDEEPLTIAAIRDVSERVQAEQRLAQFVEFAPDGIVGVGEDGRIVLVNAQTERLFGYGRDELIGEQLELLVPDRFRKAHAPQRTHYFDNPRSRPMGADVELSGRRRDGTEFPAEISLSSIAGIDGPLAIAAIRDITDRKRVDREKQDLEARLEETRRLESEREKRVLEEQLNQLRRLESVGQLAGGIAHDFNNLLGVIMNYAQFVADELDPQSAAWEDVEEIRRAAERAAALTRQLLIFSRREVVRPQVLELNTLVAELDKLLRRALGEHIVLETRFAESLWPIEADPGQIEQVLVNLAVNGRDAMPGGGKLLVETANVELDDGFRKVDPSVVSGPYVRLTVSDTGCGMTPELIERAFEPFFTTKPRGEGTGLGLTTVYGIVTDAGGNIQISSEPAVGTTIRVHIPASGRAPAAAAGATREAPAARGETVLVVEDSDSLRTLTARILEDAGYHVLVAATGRAALDCIERDDQVIDLLLTDVVMPEMPGPELVRRATAIRPDLNVLYMSGYIHQVVSQLGPADADIVAHVEKPFTGEVLRTKVREAIDEATTATTDDG